MYITDVGVKMKVRGCMMDGLTFHSKAQGKESLPSRPRVCCWLSFQLGPSGKNQALY